MKSRQKNFALFCAIVSVVLCIFSCKNAPVEEQPDNTPKSVSYTVKHMQQAVNGDSYVEVEADRQVLNGKVGEPTAAAAKNYTGFTAQEITQKLITADGKTEVSVYYKRNEVTLKIDHANGTSVETIKGLFGTAVKVADPVKANSTFSGWKPALPSTFPAASVQTAYVAQWDKIAANYTVKHLQQDVSGSGYTEVTVDRETKSGYAGDNTAATAKSYTGFTVQTVAQKTIAADGSTVVEIKYDRKTITFTINLNGGTTATTLTNGKLSGLYGATVSVANPEKAGWIFIGWNTEGGQLPATFTSDGSYTAMYDEDAADYKVRHYQQDVSGSGYTEVTADLETKKGIVGNNTAAVAKSYAGFTAQEITQELITADGKTEVSVYYNRKTVSLTINLNGGTTTTVLSNGKLTGLYGADVSIAEPSKDDYSFLGWNPELPDLFPAESPETVYKALWYSDSKTEAGISVTLCENPDINISGVVQDAGKVTFTAEDGFANYRWYVNGMSGVQGTGRTFVLNTTNLSEDCYTVTVSAEKGGFPHSSCAYVELDKTAPAKVSGLSVSAVDISSNKVSLEWTNPSDSDFKNVKVYWTESDGEHSTEVSGTKGAAASTDITVADARNSYEFKVKSVDEYGNESSSKYVTSNMVMKIVSDGTYDLSSAKRWAIVLDGTGFDYNTPENKFSFKFKFTNTNAKTSDMYVRTNATTEADGQFLYYGPRNGTVLTALGGEWAGWYEVSGTIVSGGASRFEIAFNTSTAGVITSSDALYIADLKCGPNGNVQTIVNSVLTVSKRSDITPVKSYETLGNAN